MVSFELMSKPKPFRGSEGELENYKLPKNLGNSPQGPKYIPF